MGGKVLLYWAVIFCANVAPSEVHRIYRDSLSPASLVSENEPEPIRACIGCSQKFTVVESDNTKYVVNEPEKFSITEAEYTALRIEYIKNQILKKLRLKEKPSVSMSYLPRPVEDNETILPKYDDEDYEIDDDFYGKTTQAIIFPVEDAAKCIRQIRYPSACLPFKLPNDVHPSDVSTAELFIYKNPDILDSHNQTFVISEVAHWDTKRSFQKTKPIAIQETDKSIGWLKIDVAYVVKNWLEFQDTLTHAINVVCKTCGMDIFQSPISFETSLKPFLVIGTHSQSRVQPRRRSKRQIKCSPGINECCKEELYVSFSEIGWDDWIISPQGYRADYCRGSCSTAATLTLSGSEHNSIMHRVIYANAKNKSSSRKIELTPCCTATHFKPIQLLYLANNKTITSKLLPNMAVESCGCM